MPGPCPTRHSSALSAGGGGQPRRFIDLFCGIGGFRLAFERLGARCMFSSDRDKFSRETYTANFGETPCGDIRTVAAKQAPAHDILCGGFPCQPFSPAGVSKKKSLGRSHGFDNARQGNLFFEMARLLKHHRLAAFVLENVKNLQSHDQGRTFGVIRSTLTEEPGYTVHHRIIDARAWVPQHRERIFWVGFRQPRDFSFPVPPPQGPVLRSHSGAQSPGQTHPDGQIVAVCAGLRRQARGAGQRLRMQCLRCRRRGPHPQRPLLQGWQRNSHQPRARTQSPVPDPRKCSRLMGYPDSYQIPVSDTRAYRQFGNSVAVPVVAVLAESVMAALDGPAGSPDENPAELSMVPAHEASPRPGAMPLGTF